jgi:hypothetical protein
MLASSTCGHACRDTIRRVCEELGVKSFIPRSYIEQVQLLQLTQEFAQITDKARAHFEVGDDVIIDDHLIGCSPARKLNMGGGSLLRHSTDLSLRALSMQPQRQAFGFPSVNLSGSAPVASDSALQKPMPPCPGSLSRDLHALTMASDHTNGVHTDRPLMVHDVAVRGSASHGSNGLGTGKGLDEGNGHTITAKSLIPGSRPSNCMEAEASRREVGAHSDAKTWSKERNQCLKGVNASTIMDVRADIKAVACEVRNLGESMPANIVLSVAVASAVAGCALGLALSMAIARR